MVEVLTVKSGLKFLNYVMICHGTYPLSDIESKFFRLMYRFLWWFWMLNNVSLMILFVYVVFTMNNTIDSASYSLIEVSTLLERLFILILFKCQQYRIKTLMNVMEKQLSEKEDRQTSSINNTYLTLISLMFACYFSVLYWYLKLDVQRYSFFTKFALSFEKKLADGLFKLNIFNQMVAGFHGLVLLITDGIVVLFIHTSTMSLKRLDLNLKDATCYDSLKKCIREHQNIYFLIKETNSIVRLVVIKTVIFFIAYCLCSGIQLFNQHIQISELFLHCLIIAAVFLRVYICAESAENMISAAENINSTIESTVWYTAERDFVKSTVFMLQRNQKLPKIHLDVLMPNLNRQYLWMILRITYSYFMAILTLLQKRDLLTAHQL